MQQEILTNPHVGGFYKIGNVSVPVPFRQPGNVVKHLATEFEVWENAASFHAIPLCSKESRKILDLPLSLEFRLKGDNSLLCSEQHRETINNILDELVKIDII